MLRINSQRLWNRIHTMAQIGATPNGGVNRLALTHQDKLCRDLFIQWAKSIGCQTRVDSMGNIFVRLEGLDHTLPPILFGSHLDSQPTGGKYDGSLGVLAGLELIETLIENNYVPEYPLELVSWTSEEGARFTPAMISSGVFGNVFSLDYAHNRTDDNGMTIKKALEKIGYLGREIPYNRKCSGYFELHIEQGPILDKQKKSIGIVQGVQGIRWYELTVKGQEVHAGPFPMNMRKDPIRILPTILTSLYNLSNRFGEDARLTIGKMNTVPGSQNTVPHSVSIAIDIRHPHQDILTQMHHGVNQIIKECQNSTDLEIKIQEIWHCPPIAFDLQCIQAIKKATRSLALSSLEMVSGAGHDAVYLSKVTPTAMIFIPCKDGISHNERESITKTDAVNGANVLLWSILHYIDHLSSNKT
ncbi:MAG: M20 family metallo-hydrolase [Flavobacteriaceae bacterium]|nr:M20 family metallo-hydrolase [Flavobacteriaceae bacterium]